MTRGTTTQAANRRISREDFLTGAIQQQEEVEIPEWEATVMIRALSLEQVQRIRRLAQDAGTDDFDLAVFTVIEGMADPTFDAGDAPALRRRSAAILLRLAGRITDLSGLTGAALASAEKN